MDVLCLNTTCWIYNNVLANYANFKLVIYSTVFTLSSKDNSFSDMYAKLSYRKIEKRIAVSSITAVIFHLL